MSLETEKRQFHRIFYNAKARLTFEKLTLECEIIDISLNGCLLRFIQPWNGDLEQLYKLDLELSDDKVINMELSVSHVVNNIAGFKCEHIDIESITELRRLVELNLGDSQLLERDLLALSSNIH